MVIESNSLKKREDALRFILTNISKLDRNFKGKNYNNEIDMMSFVPEGLVSLCIGHKGRLIQRIKDETDVKVIINQRVRGMSLRSAFATGEPNDLARACTIMYNTLEE